MSETAETTGWTGAEQMEVLTFELNGELFALEAVAVQEIMDLAPETVVPGAGAFAGAATSLIFGFLTLSLSANQTATGLALTIFGTGLAA